MTGRLSGYKPSVTATIKTIARKGENGFDKFMSVRFMSLDAPPAFVGYRQRD